MNLQKKSYSIFTILDIFCMSAGFFLGIFLRHGDFAIMNTYSVYREVFVVLAITILANSILFKPYEDIFRRGMWTELVNVLKCLAVQGMIAMLYMYIVQSSSHYSRLAFAFAIISISILTYTGRLIGKTVFRNIAERNDYRKRLLVVTTSKNAARLLQETREEMEFYYQVSALAIMDCDMVGQTIEGVSVTANAESLYDDARLMVVDSVLIDLEPENPCFKETVNLFHVMGVEMNVSLFEYNLGIPNQQIMKMGGLTVLSGNTQQTVLGDVIAKRMLDVIGGVVGLLLTVILTLFVGPAIVIESPGPVFFSQTRVGKNGRRFKIYKFRSMYMDAEEKKKS